MQKEITILTILIVDFDGTVEVLAQRLQEGQTIGELEKDMRAYMVEASKAMTEYAANLPETIV